MRKKQRHISRELDINTSSSIFYTLFPPFLGKFTLLSILPAFFYSCTAIIDEAFPEYGLHVSKAAITDNIHTLDVFIFRDDDLQRLDCYQRFDGMDDWKGTVVSGSGKRIITAVANSGCKREEWFSLSSRAYLDDVILNLEDESRGSPFMAGETSADAGSSAGKNLQLRPFASEIRLKSLSCDFKGKAYEGEKISGVKVYLTNVNAECRILEEDGSPPRRIINGGGLNMDDLDAFRQKDLIMQEIPGEVGVKTIYPDIRLWCYQSCHPEETPGTPFTRLVIEGRMAGRTYYWPIDINREAEEESGILRNRRYEYDIRITRKGSDNPDSPVRAESITINQEIREWKEKEGYEVSF